MDECSLVASCIGPRQVHAAQRLAPPASYCLGHLPDHPACIRLAELKKDGGCEGELDGSIMGSALQDRCLKMRVAIGCRVDIEDRRQAPLSCANVQETMVLQMIVFVGYAYREYEAPLKFMEISLGVEGVHPHEIDDLCIGSERGPGPAEGRAGRDVGNPCPAAPVKASY